MNINRFNQWSLKLKLRLIFGFILLIIFVFFLGLKIVPKGKISYSFSPSKANSFLSARGAFRDFRPGARIDVNDKKNLKIISDPLYFRVFAARNFNKAKVTLKYQDSLSSSSPIIELGLLRGGQDGSYDLQAVENKIISRLSSSWFKIESDKDFLILQKENNYKNEADFWQDFSQDKLIDCEDGVLNCTTFYKQSIIKEYSPAATRVINPKEIDQALRGGHQFFVYFPEGEWYLDFSFRNLGLKTDGEKIELKVFSDSELIAEKSLVVADVSASKEAFNNDKRQGKVIENLGLEGKTKRAALYRVEVKASDDIIIEKIRSSSDHLVFINQLWPVYEKQVLHFYTAVNNISLKTFETESLAELSFADDTYQLDKTYYNLQLQSAKHSSDIKELSLGNTGILIELNGVMALDRESYFNPVANKLDRFFSTASDAEYLLASYTEPREEENFKIATLDFDLSGANNDEGFYSFVISIPGLTHNSDEKINESENYLKIKGITVEFEGKSLFAKIIEKLNEKRRSK